MFKYDFCNYLQEKIIEDTNINRNFIFHIESSNVNVGISIETLFLLELKYNFDIRMFFDEY